MDSSVVSSPGVRTSAMSVKCEEARLAYTPTT
jgi:hypothetical protein